MRPRSATSPAWFRRPSAADMVSLDLDDRARVEQLPGLVFGRTYARFLVEIVGVPLVDDEAPRSGREYQAGGERYDVRAQRVRRLGTAAYLEWVWTARNGETLALLGLEAEDRDDEAQRVLDALPLVRIGRKGRPAGRRAYSADELRERVPAEARTLRRDRVRPSYRTIAPVLGLDESNLKDAIRAYGLDWQLLIRRP